MNNQASTEKEAAARYQVLLVIWVAQVMALLGIFLLSAFVFDEKAEDSSTLLWVFTAASLTLVGASFLVKQKLFAQAVEKQSAALVQQGQIAAIAMCEAAGLFGLLVRAIAGSPYFYLPFIIAGLGMLLHFPRREALMAASFKNRL